QSHFRLMKPGGESLAREGDNLALTLGQIDRFTLGRFLVVDLAGNVRVTFRACGADGDLQLGALVFRDGGARQVEGQEGYIHRLVDTQVDINRVDGSGEPVPEPFQVSRPAGVPGVLRAVGEDVEKAGQLATVIVPLLVQLGEQAVDFGQPAGDGGVGGLQAQLG